MNNFLKDFIVSQREAILPRFTRVMIETTPLLSPENAPQLAEKIYDYYTGLALNELQPDDEFVRSVVADNRALGVTPELGKLRVQHFFGALREQAETSSSFNPTQKDHLLRLINQSERFLLTLALMLRNPYATPQKKPE